MLSHLFKEYGPWAGDLIIQPYYPGVSMSASYLVGADGRVDLLGVGWQEVEVLAWSFHYNLFRSASKGERIDLSGAEAGLRDLAARERAILAGVRDALDRF